MVLRESQVQVSVSAPINSVVNKRFAASYGFIDTSVYNADVFFYLFNKVTSYSVENRSVGLLLRCKACEVISYICRIIAYGN